MKFKVDRPLAEMDTAVRKLLEIANAMEPEQGDRLNVAPVNRRFSTPAEVPMNIAAPCGRQSIER